MISNPTAFRFGLSTMMRYTAYMAVAAMFIAQGKWWIAPILLGFIWGFEAGIKTRYNSFLLAICGGVAGLAAMMGIWGATSMPKAFAASGPFWWMVLFLSGACLFVCLIVCVWFVCLVIEANKSSRSNQPETSGQIN